MGKNETEEIEEMGQLELNKDGKMMIFDKENYLKPFDLNDVCTCFEDEVYVLS